jgi:hypothetical protein
MIQHRLEAGDIQRRVLHAMFSKREEHMDSDGMERSISMHSLH